jgi:serine/threonine protein kinase
MYRIRDWNCFCSGTGNESGVILYMKSKKRNYRRTKKRKTKRREKKGGDVIGKGSDGVVLWPGYRIRTMSFDSSTVSKVFTGQNNRKGASDSANYEMAAEEMLHTGTTRNGIQIPSNYFVLPIEMFSMDKSELSPIDKTQLSDVFDKLPTPIWMITYPKGEMSAYDYIKRIVIPQTIQTINVFLTLYENVAYAVKRMQTNDIVHRDFKLDNVLFIHGTFKIADITFLSRIQDINSNSEYLGISRYYPFPSIYGFTALFESPAIYKSIHGPKLVSYINSELASKSDIRQSDYSTRLFNDYINLFKSDSLERNEAIILQSYHFNLHRNTTIETLSKLLFNIYQDDLRLFKTYLFLTIDTYSFGMSLMKVAVYCFINHKTSKMLLAKLHSIIYKCCEFSVYIKNFDDIYNMYVDMINNYL